MRIRLQYFLIVMLYLAVGTLCRQSMTAPVAATTVVSASTYQVQDTDAHPVDVGYLFAHSMLASDTQSDFSSHSDYKNPARNQLLIGYASEVRHPGVSIRLLGRVVVHPDTKAYYIFSLGKIRI